MAQAIPLQATASQILNVQLGEQPVRLEISQKSTGLFTDIYVNGVLVLGGVIGRNKDRMVRNSYLGFIGDLTFIDTAGDEDPYYDGLGSRWQLVYLP